MSLKLGTTTIAGVSQNTKYNAHHLLDFKWSDCIMNDVSWLRADTFSWQSGDVYTSAYNHLVADISGITAETETIGSYTVTFYRATDGHKICLADQETTIANIYSETGIAWYYIIDTTNTQFKLPRTKYGFEGLRTNVGDKINESLPNITGTFTNYYGENIYGTGAFLVTSSAGQHKGGLSSSWSTSGMTFDASRSSSTYQNNAPVQEKATQMYLYFYVGDYSQTAIEQTAGITTEQLNDKVDIKDLVQVYPVIETYSNGTSWYRVYSDGWCEQGGEIQGLASSTAVEVSFLKEFADTNYYINVSDGIVNSGWAAGEANNYMDYLTSAKFTFKSGYGRTCNFRWRACGYIN